MFFDINHEQLAENIRLVRNTSDVEWNGKMWTAFPIDVEDATEDGKTLPALNMKIASGGGLITTYLQKYGGLIPVLDAAKAGSRMTRTSRMTYFRYRAGLSIFFGTLRL